jgi:very-short-patch-repair endonuclease
MAWYGTVWLPLEQKLCSQGCRWSALLAELPADLSSYGDLKRLRSAAVDQLPQVLAAEMNRRRLAKSEEWQSELRRRVELSMGAQGEASVVQRLHRAVANLDAGEYQEAFERLTDLQVRNEMLTRRVDLLKRLETAAPGWAAAIRDRQGVHGQRDCPEDPDAAWTWRQLNDELARRSAVSMEELQGKIRALSEQLQQLTASLVEKRSWASQVRRTNQEQRQALHGWKLSVKRAGKGTGKRAPGFLAEARRLMPICQSAVPVWIMPLSRVVENFDPRRNRFDVVIIDEASQADVMALTALYMGNQVVIVGDDQQVSPSAVGQDVDEVRKLIDEHLEGIPMRQHYDGQLSMYELGLASFQPVCLREHFRCISPIIQFSNHLSYGGKITPLRDASDVQRRPPTVVYRAPDTDGAISQEQVEAQTVASLVVAVTEQQEYESATIGVIGMVRDEQAMRIDALLRRFLSTTAYAHHKIQCGNPANFQGDERDVIFLSMVDSNTGTGPLSLRGAGANDMFKKRFNVAASRARDQMWVVHSLNPDTDLKPEDIRLRIIRHAEDPYALVKLMEHEEKRTESEFERLVLQRLMNAGYRVKTQWPVGAYRIDMVVEGAGKRLAVECDGDRYHTMEDLPQDMARQAILERLGWRFVRIRGSLFFRDPDEAMRPVFERLQTLGIPPEAIRAGEPTQSVDELGRELKERIIRRAAELRSEWAEEGYDTVSATPTRDRRFGRRQSAAQDAGQAKDIRKTPEAEKPKTQAAVVSRVATEETAAIKVYKEQLASLTPQRLIPSTPQETDGSTAVVVQQNLFPEPVQQKLFPELAQQTFFPEPAEAESQIVSFLRQVNVPYVDKRPNGGALWMVGGSELQPLVEKFRIIGVEFTFVAGGGKATQHRNAWFTKNLG